MAVHRPSPGGMAQCSDLFDPDQLPAAGIKPAGISYRCPGSLAVRENHANPGTPPCPLEASLGENALKRQRGNGGCRRDDEEALYPQTRPVLGLYLSLHPHPPPCARRSRNAGILSRLSAFRASDGLDAGSPWAHRTYARAGTLHPPAHPPGRVARPDLEHFHPLCSVFAAKKEAL